MQHVVPNNVTRCCVEILRTFGQAFMLMKTNVDISINNGNRHFVQMLKRKESGTSARRNKFFLVLMLRFVFSGRKANASISARRRKRKTFDPYACASACVNPVFTVK